MKPNQQIFKVGQILFVVPSRQTLVVPMQIVEELTKKSLQGTEVDYILRSSEKLISLKEIQGEIFESAEKAKASLTERAIKSVMKLVDRAVLQAREQFPSSFENVAHNESSVDFPTEIHNNEVQELSNDSTIDLGNGVKARIKLPDVFNG